MPQPKLFRVDIIFRDGTIDRVYEGESWEEATAFTTMSDLQKYRQLEGFNFLEVSMKKGEREWEAIRRFG